MEENLEWRQKRELFWSLMAFLRLYIVLSKEDSLVQRIMQHALYYYRSTSKPSPNSLIHLLQRAAYNNRRFTHTHNFLIIGKLAFSVEYSTLGGFQGLSP